MSVNIIRAIGAIKENQCINCSIGCAPSDGCFVMEQDDGYVTAPDYTSGMYGCCAYSIDDVNKVEIVPYIHYYFGDNNENGAVYDKWNVPILKYKTIQNHTIVQIKRIDDIGIHIILEDCFEYINGPSTTTKIPLYYTNEK